MVSLNTDKQKSEILDIESILRYIGQLTSYVESLDKKRIAARGRLNIKWAEKDHSYWGGIRIVKEILDRNKDKDTPILIKELKASLNDIGSKDKSLGGFISRILAIDEDESSVLNDLLNKLKEGKAEGLLDYLIREYRGEEGKEPLPQRLARFKDKRLADDIGLILRNAALLEEKLRGRIGFLHNFLNRLDSLGKEAGSLNNYIEEFKRLIQSLRAADLKSGLADKIEASNIIKQLLNYHDEIEKMQEYLGLVERGMREASWEEFLKVFYPKLDAEEGIIRDKFGDLQAANAMELTRKRYSQYPVAWQRLFQELLIRKRSEAHIRGLMALCYKKINELINEEIGRIEGVVRKQLTVQLMKIEGRIKARIKEFKGVKTNVKSIIRNREKTLMEFLKATRKEFGKIERKISMLFEGNVQSLVDTTKLRIDTESETLRRSSDYRKTSLQGLAQNLLMLRQAIKGIVVNPRDSRNFASIYDANKWILYLLNLEVVEGIHAERINRVVNEETPTKIKTTLTALLQIKESLEDALSYLELRGFIEKTKPIIRSVEDTTKNGRGLVGVGENYG